MGAKKTGRGRSLPLSTRLVGVLEMVTLDPAGEKYKPDHYVFGAFGARVRDVKKAWETCVLVAHGHTQLRAIDLHFHDLRHEAGWPIHHVQAMLGHGNLAQTSTYLHAHEHGLQESMRRFDPGIGGKVVANETSIEQPPVRHDESEERGNKLLH